MTDRDTAHRTYRTIDEVRAMSMGDRELLERIYAALGTIRQDMGALHAAVSRLEGIVVPTGSEEPWCNVPECNCHAKEG
jgi:hypothetical protein